MAYMFPTMYLFDSTSQNPFMPIMHVYTHTEVYTFSNAVQTHLLSCQLFSKTDSTCIYLLAQKLHDPSATTNYRFLEEIWEASGSIWGYKVPASGQGVEARRA